MASPRSFWQSFLLCTLVFLAVEARSQVVISEFMAVNTNTNIRDEDGSAADWIELQNTGASTVSLNGWYLTDDATDLRKWQFPQATPAVSLAPGARLLVWASGKDRKLAVNRLHTNFKLDAGGEYLALVKPDGLTPEYHFSPQYPPQVTDVAYGISGGRQWNVLAGPSLSTQWRVYTARESAQFTAQAGWNSDAGFDVTAWAQKGTTITGGVPKGIGYDSGGSNGTRAALVNYAGTPNGIVSSAADFGTSSGIYNNNGTGANAFTGTPTLCMRSTFSVADRTAIKGLRVNIRYDDGFILYVNGTVALTQNAPSPVEWNSAAPTNRDDALSANIDTFDLAAVIPNLVNGTNVIAIHAFNDVKNSTFFVMTPEIQTQTTVGGTWTTVIGPTLSSQWRVKMPFSAAEFTRMNGWTGTSFTDGAWVSKGTRVNGANIQGIGYDSAGSGGPRAQYINYSPASGQPSGVVSAASDVGLYGMYNTSGSGTDGFSGAPTLLMRTTFNVADPSTIQQLRLNIRYDDGFVLYLNGTELTRQNAPATTTWNSAASSDREDDRSEEYETISLAGAQANLIAGTNVVAIHGLNEAKNSGHFVITPSLEAFQTVSGATGGTLGYLVNATPGAENSVATTAIGPDISKTVSNPPQPVGGAGSAPVLVTARLQRTLNAVAAATCYYVINFGSEVAVAMKDDGTGGDAFAGDGIFTASVPTTSLLPGHMLRWRIESVDSAGNKSTDPPYRDPYDNDQYYGTMAQTPTITSNLPVLYWFHNSTSTNVFATTENGFRSSVFFKLPGEATGRFYDNVRINLHGQSTAGFGKKSQNFNFNADNRFTWKIGEKPIRGMNLLSNWADKSKVRNALAWETWNLTRHPSHWCQPVRVQQVTAGNLSAGVDAQFLCITDMVEDGNEEFLERWGLDGDGALYKVYNSLDNTTQNSSTNGGGVEKKTREYENFSDLQALVNAMNTSNSVSARRQWLYDNVDVPGLINYLAVHNLIQSHDFGHKNYYIYRDTNGTGEWTLIPWDQDLSFGHRWTSAQNYFDDDLDSASSIFLGGGGNRLMNIINTSGATELSQMYVRRLRTLMDRFYGPPANPINHFATRIDAIQHILDPAGATGLTDAERDFQKWGFWVDGSGTVIPWTDARAVNHRLRPTAVRIKTTNDTSIYPGANPYSAYGSTVNLNTSLEPFIPGRRKYLYNANGLNPSIQGQPIPAAQPAVPNLSIESINFNPGGTDQLGEYFVIRNPNNYAVDISDWTISGIIDYQFRPGTVIAAQTTSTSDGSSSAWINQLVVARNPARFRARTTSPKAGEYRQVVGGYDRQLSARGGTLELRDGSGTLIASANYAGSATPAQQSLRITELNYAPLPPTTAEAAALPGVQASDFEFIELTNTSASSLALGGAQFDKGITFSFPAGFSLAPGQRAVLASHQAAFQLRYGAAVSIAGQFEGNLSNSGERLRLLDSVGEVVLDFTYDPLWFGTAALGYSLVAKNPNPAYDGYEIPTNWVIGQQAGGTPGSEDTSFSETFESWRYAYFSPAELLNAAVAGVDADADTDDRSNFGEYVYGRHPRQTDPAPLSTGGRITVEGVDYLTITFARRARALDVNYIVEASSDLSTWTAADVLVGTPTATAPGVETVTFRDTEPLTGASRFMRVRAVRK